MNTRQLTINLENVKKCYFSKKSWQIINIYKFSISGEITSNVILTASVIGPDIQKKISVKLKIFSYPSMLTFVLGAQKNRLIETILLSTHNISFGW